MNSFFQETFTKEIKGDLVRRICSTKKMPEDIKQEPEKLKLFTFDDLYRIANSAIIIPLLQYDSLRKLIDSQEKFLRLCLLYNLNLIPELLKDERIKKMMLPVLKDLEHHYQDYNFNQLEKDDKNLISQFPTDVLRVMKLKNEERNSISRYEDPDQKVLLQTFPPVKKFIDQILYGDSGYYTLGTVDLTKHFSTHVTDKNFSSPLSAAFAFQIYHVRLKLLKEKKISHEDKFMVLECGAGNGILCKNILKIIDEMAQLDETWAELNSTIQYNIIEISPVLMKIQQKTTQEFVKKVNIQLGDAKNVNAKFGKNSIAVAISNELIDNIMPEVVVHHEKRGLVIRQVIPRMRSKDLKESKLSQNLKIELEQNSEKLIKLLEKYGYSEKDWVVLSEKDFFMLHNLILKKEISIPKVSFIPLNVLDIKLDSKIHNYVKENPEIFNRKQKTDAGFHLQIGARDYLLNLHDCLLAHGEVITVDYCYDLNNYVLSGKDRFLVINHQIKHSIVHDDIFLGIGSHDISVYADMTNLAETEGYQVLFYGKEEQLKLDKIPNSILTSNEKLKFKELNASEHFVVLVQHKLDADEKKAQSEVDSERFEGKCLPVTKQQVKQHLHNLFATAADYPHQELYKEALLLCKNESFLNEIKQKHYAAALRKAAAAGSVELVTLLLKYKSWLAQSFDVNESSKNGKTAYDWIGVAAVSNTIKDRIKQLLRNAGAKEKPLTNESAHP